MSETTLRMSRDFVRDRMISLGGYGWAWIGGITLVGACALTILPERIWGRYAGGDGESDGGHCG